MRSQLGREAPFPFPPQVAPPSTVNDARAMIRAHADAGVDGLILTYPDELPNAFVTGSDVVQILLEGRRAVAPKGGLLHLSRQTDISDALQRCN